jgi:hypothetical protein
MKSALLYVAAFFCGLLYDYVWTCCVDSVRDRRATRAANLGVILYVCALLSTVLIVEKCVWAVILYGIGNWVGVYLAVRKKP